MYLPSKKTSPYLSSPNFSTLECNVQSNIGLEIICSGHHQRDGFCNLHAGSRTAFSKSLRMEVSSRSTRSQVKEDIQNNTNNKNTTMILVSRSFGVKKLNKSLYFDCCNTHSYLNGFSPNHKESYQIRKSHGISR